MFGNGKEKREENREKALQDFLQKYSIKDLDPDNEKLATDAALRLENNAALSVGFTGKIEETTKISLLTAITEQNWIIINQLNRLNENIEKLANE